MALSAPHADYTSALISGVKEDYLVKLNWYDTDGPATGTVGLSMSTSEIINSVYYTPCIMKPPVIREKINLKDYTSSFGNVTIECSDFLTSLSSFPLDNASGLFSGEFHSNSANRYYMNRTVEIFSMLNDQNNESKFLKIFSGRLTRVSVNSTAHTVRLETSSYNPFEHIEIPTARDSESNIPAPIAYGSFTPNAFGGYATSKDLYKCPILDKGMGNLVRMVARDTAISSEAHPHYYDQMLDQFVPVATTSGGNLDGDTLSYNGLAVSLASDNLYRSAKQKPISFSSDSGSGWLDTQYAFNNASADDTSNYARSQQGAMDINVALESQTHTNSVGIYDLPKFSGRPTAYTIVIVYKLRGTISSGSSNSNAEVRLNARVNDNTFSTANTNSIWNYDTNALTVNTIGSAVISGLHTQTFTVPVDTIDGFPGQLALRTEALIEEADGSGELEFEHYAYIYDIRITCTQAVDFRQTNYGNLQSGMRELLGIDYLYCGADGYTQSWSASTAVTTIVDLHRDLIYRFGGITATPTNWSTLDSARSNRTVSFSMAEPRSLQDLMNLVQHEGNFIFRVDCTGAYKYIDPHATRDVTSLGLYQTELVTNGTFDSDASGWSNLRCDLSVVSNKLRVSSNAISGNAYAYRNIDAVVGKKYTVTYDFVAGNTSGCKIAVGQTNALSTGTFQGSSTTLTSNTSGTFDFTATATTQTVWLFQVANNANGTYDEWDNISVKEKNLLIFTSSQIDSWGFSLTPISDVLTKYNSFYNMHPGTGDFINKTTTTNTTPRTNYNLGNQTNENVKDKEFNILNSSTGVAEWVTNKFDFYGQPGLMCQFDIKDPSKYYMEVGDFFKFDSTIGYAFGMSVVDQVWICTEMTRTVGNLKIKGFYLGSEA